MFYERDEEYYLKTMVQARVTVKRILELGEISGYLPEAFSYSRRLMVFFCGIETKFLSS